MGFVRHAFISSPGTCAKHSPNISASIHTLSLIRQSTNHSRLNSRSVTYFTLLDMTPSTPKVLNSRFVTYSTLLDMTPSTPKVFNSRFVTYSTLLDVTPSTPKVLNSRFVTYSTLLDTTPSTPKVFKRVTETDSIIMRGVNCGGRVLGLIFAGYVPLASRSPYPIIVYSVANYRPHLSQWR